VRRRSPSGTRVPVMRLNRKLSSIKMSTAEENNASVCTPSRLFLSKSSAIAVIKKPPSTPASWELDAADDSTLHWSDVHSSSGFTGVRGRP
jgi:hypothetical protein